MYKGFTPPYRGDKNSGCMTFNCHLQAKNPAKVVKKLNFVEIDGYFTKARQRLKAKLQ